MYNEDVSKEMARAGITCTSDGLLRDFVSRGMTKAALAEINNSIVKRNNQITYLLELKTYFLNKETNEQTVQTPVC